MWYFGLLDLGKCVRCTFRFLSFWYYGFRFFGLRSYRFRCLRVFGYGKISLVLWLSVFWVLSVLDFDFLVFGLLDFGILVSVFHLWSMIGIIFSAILYLFLVQRAIRADSDTLYKRNWWYVRGNLLSISAERSLVVPRLRAASTLVGNFYGWEAALYPNYRWLRFPVPRNRSAFCIDSFCWGGGANRKNKKTLLIWSIADSLLI